ncbi:MAG: FlgD immunoglobulin-like domain containing protein [Candidatus Eisenbacteria bacterium]
MRYQVGALLCAFVLVAIGMSGTAQATITPTTVYDVQQGVFTAGVDSVFVDSVVVTAVDYKATTYGFNVQELGGGPWSGILVYISGDYPTVNPGDLISVYGLYNEYSDHSEIEAAIANVVVIEADYGMPDCELLSCNDLSYYAQADSDWAEKWEGVWICVDTVVVSSLGDYGEWTVAEYHTHPGESPDDDWLRIDEKLIDPTMGQPPLGDTLSLISGVYAEEWGNYRLWPRGTEDLVFMGPSPGPNLVLAYATSDSTVRAVFDRDLNKLSCEDEANYAFDGGMPIQEALRNAGNIKAVDIEATLPFPIQPDSLAASGIFSLDGYPMSETQKYGFITGVAPIASVQQPAYAGTDSSQWENQQVTITGVVTSASAALNGPFFMQDAPGAWNGMYVYYPAGTYALWDSVTISGIVDEYYGLTEITSLDYAVTHGNTPRPSWMTKIYPALVQDSVYAESFEGVLVNMDSVYVYTYLYASGEWDCGQGTDSVTVGDFINDVPPNPPSYDYPGLGSLINIQGCWRYHFEHQIEPRDAGDITILDPCPAGVRARDLAVPYLHQNAPNPFASETMIKFSLPSKMEARVVIYDVSGRLVKVVAEGVMDAGENRVDWNGKDTHGAQVSPGIYFYSLTTPNRHMQNKMVRLR